QEPELESTEAPAKRNRPFAVVDQSFASVRLQKFRLNSQRSDQGIGIAHEMGRAVELCAEPFVRIEHQAVGGFDPGQRLRNSGQITAPPAQPASTCTYRP